jgi:glucan 1,3-beta-glucosidase
LAINNCGKWLNGVDSIPSYESTGQGSCTRFEEWFNWDQEMKDGLNSYCLSTMDALQNWFFWTWRIGNSTELGYAPSPFWHYRLGLKEGWIPKDPRVAGGYCGNVMKVGGNQVCTFHGERWLKLIVQFDGNFPASATGAVASPTIAAAQVAIHAVWPPASMGPSYTASQISLFPTLTQTGTPITLPTPSAKATGLGDGWFNKQDTVGAWTTVAGCPYLK